MRKHAVIALSVLLLVSCAHVISQETRTRAKTDVPFKELLSNPGSYLKEVFIVGGIIAETRNTQKGTEIEIVQAPLDRYGAISNEDISEGRFIVFTGKRLDPLIFKKGRSITVAGELIGTRKGMLGEAEYLFPVFEVREIHLWREERYHYVYPYAYPYWWYDPFYSPYPYYWHYPWRRPYLYPW